MAPPVQPGKKDVCTKGLSCGVACIAKNKECLKNLSPEGRARLLAIIEQIQIANPRTIEGARQGKSKSLSQLARLDEKLTNLVDQINKGGTTIDDLDALKNTLTAANKKTPKKESITRDEMERTASRKKELIDLEEKLDGQLKGDVDDPAVVRKILQENGIGDTGVVDIYQGANIRKDVTDAMFDTLDRATRDKFINAGSVAGDIMKIVDIQVDTDGRITGQTRSTTSGVSRGVEGGKAMFYLYMRQQGRDMNTGLPLNPKTMELEHIHGLTATNSDGTKTPNKKDTLGNVGWISGGSNNTKVQRRMRDYVNSIDTPEKQNKIIEKQNKKQESSNKNVNNSGNYRDGIVNARQQREGDFKPADDLRNYSDTNLTGKQPAKDRIAKTIKDPVERDAFINRSDNQQPNDLDRKRLIADDFGTKANSGKEYIRNVPDLRTRIQMKNSDGSRGRSVFIDAKEAKEFGANYALAEPRVRKRMKEIWNEEVANMDAGLSGKASTAKLGKIISERLDREIPEYDRFI